MTWPRRLTVLALALLGAVFTLLLVLQPTPAQAAAKVVGSGTAGSCNETALRAALAGGGDIIFNCSAAPNPIILTDELVITAATTVDGTNGGHPVTISGNGVTRVFYLHPGIRLSLDNLTIRDGSRPSGEGAAIYARGTLIVTNSRLYSNTAESGGAIASLSGSVVTVTSSILAYNQATASGGGAVRLRGRGYVLSSEFHHNTAATFGGAIYADTTLALDIAAVSTFYNNTAGNGGAVYLRGPGFVTGSLFHHNTAATKGGGIYADINVPLNIAATSALYNNTAGNGGALYIAPGAVVTVTDSGLSDNKTTSESGGAITNYGVLSVARSHFLRNNSFYWGGAIASFGPRLVVSDTEIANNIADNGGGIYQSSGLGHISGSQIHDNRAYYVGAGLFVGLTAHLTLANSEVAFNLAQGGPTVSGGGLSSAGHVTATATVFHDNRADITSQDSSGGGIYQYSGGRLVLAAVDFERNGASQGGGVYLNAGVGEFADVSFVENRAWIHDEGFGGGLYIHTAGVVTLTQSVFLRNQADENGGAIFNEGRLVLANSALVSNTAYRVGGGLLNFFGSAEASNVTFSTNSAEDGGGMWNDQGTLRLAFVTFTGNIADTGSALWNYTSNPAATLYLEATLLAGNGPGYNCHAHPSSLPVQSGGYNLSDDNSFVPGIGVCPSFGVTDLSDTEPMLGPLSAGGGLIPFHSLLAGSPAIDAIPIGSPGNQECGSVLDHDQRDFSRPLDGDLDGEWRCDIGAIEMVSRVWLPLIVR